MYDTWSYEKGPEKSWRCGVFGQKEHVGQFPNRTRNHRSTKWVKRPRWWDSYAWDGVGRWSIERKSKVWNQTNSKANSIKYYNKASSVFDYNK